MLSDVIGGALPACINPLGGQMELYRAGKIRFLGVTGTRRSAMLPDVPTMKEAGADGFEMASGWFAAFIARRHAEGNRGKTREGDDGSRQGSSHP